LFIYMYAIVGVIYFGEVKRSGQMNDYINFESFISAFITLFTVATADTWNLTMASFTLSRAPWYDCIENPSYDDYLANGENTVGCGNRYGALVYFVSFMFIVSLVFLKLFIGIIIDGYKSTQTQQRHQRQV
jgi:ABC-type Na+ efflux pump permease subunit